jgi:hypothetical protein
LKYLAVGPVFRKTSTRNKLLRLIILEPVPYGKGESRGYNERAYLLTTDMSLPASDLTAFYLMRWELENIHRIFKTTLGLGDAQVQKQRLPSAIAAFYALLVVAVQLTQGEERHEGFGPLPKWTTNRRAFFEKMQLKDGKPAPRYRPSAEDIMALFRRAMADPTVLKDVRFMRLVA